MPRLTTDRTPHYRRHRASGQAVVTVAGRDAYLGLYGSRASRIEYDRVVGEWLANGRQSVATIAADYTVTELVAAFLRHAGTYYNRPDGTPTGETGMFKSAVRPLVKLYGHTQAMAFGPLALTAVRDRMASDGWCRTNINAQCRRIRSVFKWGVSKELVPSSVLEGLKSLTGLREGRTPGVRESEPVRPVDAAVVDATLPHMNPIVRAMVELQTLTGMRPGEVVTLTPAEVDTAAEVWTFKPRQHKTRHHGRERVICIGPKAQAILRPYLDGRDPPKPCFSPAEATAARLAALHARRRTPMNCGNRPGTNVRARPGKSPGDRYTRLSYAAAITSACRKAFPPVAPLAKAPGETTAQWQARLTDGQRHDLADWHRRHHWAPNQLRHSVATNIRKAFGIEAVQVTLGHADARTSLVYAERDLSLASRVAAAVG